MNSTNKERSELFAKESQVLQRIEEVLTRGQGAGDLSLLEEYRFLSRQYQSLLKDSVKLTRVGDSNQRKLMNAKEVIAKKTEELSQKNEALYIISVTDYLTGVYNRTYLMETLARELSGSRRHGFPLACILMDLDKFKAVNDTYGHLAGDSVLVEFAERVRQIVRKQDVFGRYGGEEFLLVLPNTPLKNAGTLAEKIRARLADEPIVCGEHQLSVTLSCGVTELGAHGAEDVDGLIRYADLALYLAKDKGRNRVEFFSRGLL